MSRAEAMSKPEVIVRNVLTFTIAAAMSCGIVAQAVMIRHDVDDKQYLDLANRPEFAAARVTILDPRGSYTGVLISKRHVLTCGHPVFGSMPANASQGRMKVMVRVGEKEYPAEFAYLHPSYPRDIHYGGADVAIIRLSAPGAAKIAPATIWMGGLKPGDRIVGIGQGKTGTGNDRDEPKAPGTFRGYENTIDYVFDREEFEHVRTDFDNGTDGGNTLSTRLFKGDKEVAIKTDSSKEPLPLEGAGAAHDSGSGIFVERDNAVYLSGIFSYRNFSSYGGQSSYVNLSSPAIAAWIRRIADVERAKFKTKGASK